MPLTQVSKDVVNASQTNITGVGTVTAGTWQGTLISSTYGGTGVNNAGRTLTIATNNITLTANASGSSVTLPASGTLVNTAVTSLSSLTSIGTLASNLLFTDATYDIGASGATRPRDLYLSRNIVSGGSIQDSKGDVRSSPINSKSSAYGILASDAGKTIYISTGGVTFDANILAAGDLVTIVNNSGSNQTITAGTNVTFRLSGTATTGNRTLAQYGMSTFLCVVGGANPIFMCSGAGLT